MKVYQIATINTAMVNCLGRNGFSREEICQQMPAYDAHLRTLCEGSEGYKPDDFRYYTHVATIDVESPDDAFCILNHRGCEDPRLVIEQPCKSMSVGDILETGGNGKPRRYLMVDGVGFTPITVATQPATPSPVHDDGLDEGRCDMCHGIAPSHGVGCPAEVRIFS